MVWTDKDLGTSYSVSGNDRASYAKAAAQIQSALDKGHMIDENARKILRDAEYIGVCRPK